MTYVCMPYLTDGRAKFNHSTICHQVAESADKWKSDITPLRSSSSHSDIDNQASSHKDTSPQHGVFYHHGAQVQHGGPQALLQPWFLLPACCDSNEVYLLLSNEDKLMRQTHED